MNRRRLLGLASAALLVPGAARGQRTHHLGFLSSSTTQANSPLLAALRRGLKALGYEEGKNIKLHYRFGQSKEQLAAMAAELVAAGVDAIIAGGSEGITAAKAATGTIPIVMTNSGDAVREGFAASLARPGGNITGLTQISPDLAGKRLELLKEIVPKLSRVAVLWHPAHPNTPLVFAESEKAAAELRFAIVPLAVGNGSELAAAFARAAAERAEGVMVIRDPLMVRNRALLAEAALGHRLPSMYETADFVEAGGLVSYGPDFADLYERSATCVDRILKGQKPGDLPIEQPTKFELALNLKTAKALGLALSSSLLMRADEVVE